MAKWIQHNQEVWDLDGLRFSDKLILNYLVAWKKRGGLITVQDAYLQSLYNMSAMEVQDRLNTLQRKGLIRIEYIPAGPRVIYVNDLNVQEPQGPDDIFDHLY